ncbi:Uncharacterised protein [Serratia marcescens]|nr:Uncharacterised protein [Serratia marcescens]
MNLMMFDIINEQKSHYMGDHILLRRHTLFGSAIASK